MIISAKNQRNWQAGNAGIVGNGGFIELDYPNPDKQSLMCFVP